MTPFLLAYAVSEDLLTVIEREHFRKLNAQLDGLKRSKKAESDVAHIAHELALLEELQNVRANVRITSLIYARERFNTARADFDAAMRIFEEALLNLEEDEHDGFETAFKKSLRLEEIERTSDDAGDRYDNALLKLGWEISEARKHGIVCG